MNQRPNRGVVLVVVIGVLSMLSLLAIVFTYTSRMERDISRNYVDLVRAGMLAEAGMERVFSEVRQRIPGQTSWYGGEDWNGNGNLAEAVDDQNGNYDGTLQVVTSDLQYARRPSFFADTNADGLPELVQIREPDMAGVMQTRMRGYSGVLAGTYEQSGDTYCLKVIDTASRIYLNGTGKGYLRLYDNIGALLFGRSLGALIQGNQPFASPEDLMSRGILSAAEFAQTRDYWTTVTWVDPKTIRPDPKRALVEMPGSLRLAASIEPRAPININTADSIVLQAVLRGIAGYFTDNNTPMKSAYSLDNARAANLANAIVQARSETYTDTNANGVYDTGEPYVSVFGNGRYDGPFYAWDQFKAFLPGVTGFVGNFNTWARDLVYANANPNTLLNKFQPNAHVWRGMDKSDLRWDLGAYTTEFSFTSGGTFEISSLGRVTANGGVVVAQREIRTVVTLFEIARSTSQRDFEPRDSAFGLSSGFSMAPDVMSMPEELADLPRIEPVGNDADGDGASDGPAIYDGQVTLRPADPSTSAPWSDSTANTTLRILFNDSPGVASVGPSSGMDPYPSLTADIGSPTSPMNTLNQGALRTNVERGASLLKDLDPLAGFDYSDIFPDGLFIRREKQEYIYFDSNLTLSVGQGSVGFWYKPTWNDIPGSLVWRDMYTMNQNYTYNANNRRNFFGTMLTENRGKINILYGADGGASGEFMVLEGLWYEYSRGFAGYSPLVADTGYERPPVWISYLEKPLVSSNWNPGQWHYIALRYKDQARYDVWLDGDRIDGTPAGEFAFYANTAANTYYGLTGPSPTYNHVALCSNMPWWNTIGSGTMDDWQQFKTLVPVGDFNYPPQWRYSDTGIGGYSSYQGQMDLPIGSRVKRVAWTRYLPVRNYRGENLSKTTGTARLRQPQVRIGYRMNFEGTWQTPAAQDGRDTDFTPSVRATTTGESMQFALTFDRNGQDPFRNAPTVDDVTVYYSVDGVHPKIMSWQVLP